jgi:hypothetical protein
MTDLCCGAMSSFETLKSAIVRIYHTSSAVVGAGFLVADRHLVTCAHVVAAALNLPQNTQIQPESAIEIDFPLVAPGQKVLARIVFWQPMNPGHPTEDIAGLEVLQPVPSAAQPVTLSLSQDYWQHPLRVFGFPKGHDDGLWATGILRDQSANGWIQLDALASQDRSIEPGFSGAPIWDEQLQGVVGMAVAAEKRRQDVTAAYMVPTRVLQSAWSMVKAPDSSGTQPMSSDHSIFVSYRRNDSNDVTGRIYDRLSDHFGREVVFKDVDSIPYGVDFRTHLNETVGQCQVLIVVIGPTWLKALQERSGQSAMDWVHAEIEMALGRGIPVIPLLVGVAQMPGAAELPEGLQALAYRNAAQARPDPDFKVDMERLIRGLEEIVGKPEPLSIEARQSTFAVPQSVSFAAIKKLTALQRKQFRKALISAFPDSANLALLFEDEFGMPLNQVVNANNFYEKVVADTIKWAESDGKISTLINAATESKPDNSDLQEFIQSLSEVS